MLGTLIATGASFAADLIYNHVPAVSEAIDSVLWPLAGAITGKEKEAAAALDVKYNTTKYGDAYNDKQLNKLVSGNTDKHVASSSAPIVTKAKVATPTAISNSVIDVPLKKGQVAASPAAKAKAAQSGPIITAMDMARQDVVDTTGYSYDASEYSRRQSVPELTDDDLFEAEPLPPVIYGETSTIKIFDPPITNVYETYVVEGRQSSGWQNDASVGSNIRLVNGKW